MILSSFIYLTYILHNENITEMIGGQGHVMRRSQLKVRCEQSLTILNKIANNKCFKVHIIILYMKKTIDQL